MIPDIDQAVWRAAWLLIIFNDENSLKDFCDPENKIYLRVWLDDTCLAEGYAHSMVDPETIKNNWLMLDFVSFAEHSGGVLIWPTKLEVLCGSEKKEFTIQRATRNEIKWRTWETWVDYLPPHLKKNILGEK